MDTKDKTKEGRKEVRANVLSKDYDKLISNLQEMGLHFTDFLDAGIKEFNAIYQKKKSSGATK